MSRMLAESSSLASARVEGIDTSSATRDSSDFEVSESLNISVKRDEHCPETSSFVVLLLAGVPLGLLLVVGHIRVFVPMEIFADADRPTTSLCDGRVL
jgi:hypothetical protein